MEATTDVLIDRSREADTLTRTFVLSRAAHATVIALVILLPAGDAFACFCPPSGPACQNAFEVDAVFAGTVRGILPLPDGGPPLGHGVVRTVRVEFDQVVPFRGIEGSNVSVSTDSTDCGYEFTTDQRYLVYARKSTVGGGLVAGSCSRTRPLAEAAEDIEFLQAPSAQGERARLYGTVTHYEHDMATDRPQNLGPVRNLRVSVRGMGAVVDTWTDDAGRYDVRLTPGNYVVTFMPPAGLSNRNAEHHLELSDPRACSLLNWGVRFDGRIRSRVRPPPGVSTAEIAVELMSPEAVGNPGTVPVLRAVLDGAGRFEFAEVPPGRYVVGVDLVRRMGSKVVFPPTFHPGTSDAAAATVVQLEGGQQRELEPMTLPPARRALRLTGRIVLEGGRPAAGAVVALTDGTAPFRQVAGGIQTGPDGTFSFLVHEGLSYIASASLWDSVQRRQLRGTVGPFVIRGKMEPLTVVMAAGR